MGGYVSQWSPTELVGSSVQPRGNAWLQAQVALQNLTATRTLNFSTTIRLNAILLKTSGQNPTWCNVLPKEKLPFEKCHEIVFVWRHKRGDRAKKPMLQESDIELASRRPEKGSKQKKQINWWVDVSLFFHRLPSFPLFFDGLHWCSWALTRSD